MKWLYIFIIFNKWLALSPPFLTRLKGKKKKASFFTWILWINKLHFHAFPLITYFIFTGANLRVITAHQRFHLKSRQYLVNNRGLEILLLWIWSQECHPNSRSPRLMSLPTWLWKSFAEKSLAVFFHCINLLSPWSWFMNYSAETKILLAFLSSQHLQVQLNEMWCFRKIYSILFM